MAPAVPRRRPLQFSLRSLILLMTLAGCAYGLWHKWAPWSLERVLAGHEGHVRCIQFSSDGSHLLTGGDDAIVRAWSMSDGKLTTNIEVGYSQIERLAIAPDNRHIAARVLDSAVYVWDFRRASQARSANLPRVMTRAIFGPGRISDVQLYSPMPAPKFLVGGMSSIDELSGFGFSPDSKRLVVAWGGAIPTLVIDLDARKPLDAPWDDENTRLTWSIAENGSVFGARTNPIEYQLFDNWDDSLLGRISLPIGTGWNGGLSRNGRYLYSIDKWKLTIWRTQDGARLHAAEIRDTDENRLYGRIRFSEGDSFYLIAHRYQRMEALEAETGRSLHTFDHDEVVLCWSACESRLLTVRQMDRNLYIRDGRNFRVLASVRFPKRNPDIEPVQFSQDGQRLAVGVGKEVYIYVRRRPESWWGVAVLPQLWLTVVLGALLGCSLWRDLRTI